MKRCCAGPHTRQQGLTGNVKVKGSLGCRVEVRILRAGRRVKLKLAPCTSGDLALTSLGICLEESPGIRLWREERSKKAA